MLQERLIEEIKQIPSDKLAEVYDLVHYFRLGLAHEKDARKLPTQRPIGLAKAVFQVPASFFEPLPDDLLDAFEGKQ
jgi:hypothetical protein